MHSLLVLSSLLLATRAYTLSFLSESTNSQQVYVNGQQQPMDGTSATAPGDPPLLSQDEPGPSLLRLSDTIGTQRSINIFSSLTRDVESVSRRLEDSSLHTTVLAPLNAAILSLPRKLWEDARDYSQLGDAAYEGTAGEERARANIRRFTEAYIVPVSPWAEGEKVQSLIGLWIWWEKGEDGKMYIQPGKVEVDAVVSRVPNGEVWIIQDVINYAS